MRRYIKKVTVFMLITLLLFLTACGNGVKTSKTTSSKPESKTNTEMNTVAVATQTKSTPKPTVAYITTTEGFVTQILQRARVNPATFETALSMKLFRQK
ncbi:hypothetical protein [Caldicellulosiruptor naganoensis]|uniref:Uncharacterized protein n=1 Tax=Caldicellulosiruptor naganoensis TaxID=29324 RepID=A0ABY7BIV3_9FIRM|nr:hypothetical protein [Caldicellulosiruptor naganoensis]WAM31650.1 hypothetical protein OTJ99_000081 [Caldicellulosiruptor naganoensis]